MGFLMVISWAGVPLFAALVFAAIRRQSRALAVATLIVAVPLSLLLAFNNNPANAIRNFFMGIVLFGVPLLFHAWMVSLIKQKGGAKI